MRRNKPFLSAQKGEDINICLCDRYYHSTIAFQSTQGLDQKTIIEKNKAFLKPDLAIILDIKPEIALQRMNLRKREKFEERAFMESLRDRFLALPKILKENIKIIDGSAKKTSVFEKIRKEVDFLL